MADDRSTSKGTDELAPRRACTRSSAGNAQSEAEVIKALGAHFIRLLDLLSEVDVDQAARCIAAASVYLKLPILVSAIKD